ncbi:MAG: HAD-IA family hydrolase [Clostridiales bacterium]|nr:HAD-IA family hydrolase [Clostridiales bacterium]
MIRILFFDIGYTLIDESAVWEQRCREQAQTAEAKRLGLSAADIRREIERASAERKPQYRTVVEKYRFREVAPYRHAYETLYEDAPRVLCALSHKAALGVIANQTDGLRKRLERFGILSYFTCIVSSWDVGVMKPEGRIFEIALDRAGCLPEEAVMIGDRLDNDIAPAKAVGMKTVWVRQGFGACQTPSSQADTPDYTVNCLADLPALPLF